MVDKREIHVIYEGYPCMDCSPSVIINIVDITYTSLYIQRNGNKQNKITRVALTDYLLGGGKDTGTTIQSI